MTNVEAIKEAQRLEKARQAELSKAKGALAQRQRHIENLRARMVDRSWSHIERDELRKYEEKVAELEQYIATLEAQGEAA